MAIYKLKKEEKNNLFNVCTIVIRKRLHDCGSPNFMNLSYCKIKHILIYEFKEIDFKN